MGSGRWGVGWHWISLIARYRFPVLELAPGQSVSSALQGCMTLCSEAAVLRVRIIGGHTGTP